MPSRRHRSALDRLKTKMRQREKHTARVVAAKELGVEVEKKTQQKQRFRDRALRAGDPGPGHILSPIHAQLPVLDDEDDEQARCARCRAPVPRDGESACERCGYDPMSCGCGKRSCTRCTP